MACGTGKTYTALKIAEKETNGKGLILFLVPSIALLGQTLKEWYAEAMENINAICICSDSGVTKKQTKNDDSDGFRKEDLARPASTNVKEILHQFDLIKKKATGGMTVVFSTYQSIQVIADAQNELLKTNGDTYGVFDLIVCDEAHRTTGVTLASDDTSAFVKVHDNNFIQARKRLYMTATPRLYDDNSKSKAAEAEAILCSMDDIELYGNEIYRIGFGEAVERNLLSDYKVLILTVSENDVPLAVQKMVADSNNEINSDDASKLIGCINALSKRIIGDDGTIKRDDPQPMRRAVAFCQSIAISKKIAKAFEETKNTYFSTLTTEERHGLVALSAHHVDGTMPATERDGELSWLKSTTDDNYDCRLLTNVRCLSEGVDVPSLDAVLFLSARNSQVDVVQSVGRVMRKAEGKKYGYIIIPVVVPADVAPEKALDDNERYRVVWSVLNALRAHDERFNAVVNKIELNKNKPKQIIVGGIDNGVNDDGEGGNRAGLSDLGRQLTMQFEQLQSVMFARMVQKVGDRLYWQKWAADVAQIAERYIERINRLIKEHEEYKTEFDKFLGGLRKNINPAVTAEEAVEMLAQHYITRPVFDALFEGYSFVKNNPISVSMQSMLDLLEEQNLEKDAETLQKFYESVKKRAADIDNAEAKQKIIVELYDKFFKTAFPKMVERLGIVYTPIEVVDFIIHSVEALLQKEFKRSISDENVHILDPFTGTGTFMTRLLQSGLIKNKDLGRKYATELHANEIVLLAYYIAAVNIENAYHDTMAIQDYKPFDGICLTDTFQLGESDDDGKLYSEMFPQNSARVKAQKKAPLRIIMGNPPYSVGQKSANDNAQNQSYPKLDARVAKEYAAGSKASSVKALYDAYIKAFRWSTDRLDPINGCIIAFVSNGSWIDGNGMDGFRKSLEKEFSTIYIFNLRGNQRTSGEQSRKEGGKIFGSGSRTPISITFLIKKPNSNSSAAILYHDIGDYFSREEKLNTIAKYGSVDNKKMFWQKLLPNDHGDWLNHRNDIFETFIPLATENKYDSNSESFFLTYSLGIASARDSWVYNWSLNGVKENMKRMIAFYNQQRKDFQDAVIHGSDVKFDEFISTDSTKINWNDSLKNQCFKNVELVFHPSDIRTGVYRPFYKSYLYFDKNFIQRPYQQPKLFPNATSENRVICVSGISASKDFSALISDHIINLDTIEKAQCFPLYYYEEQKETKQTLFDHVSNSSDCIRRDGISDFILKKAQQIYGSKIAKEDIFYYVYGSLHSPEYKTRFSSDLKKMLPRILLVDDVKDFWSFSNAGRKLAELHISYETVPPADDIVVTGEDGNFFKVEKMRFPSKEDKSTIVYNSKITITNIPAEAYEYIVNGKSAIEWIMERYQVTVNKDSGIKNDPNDWADEVGNPRYILDLLLSIIRVSTETVKIVNGLPKLNFE